MNNFYKLNARFAKFSPPLFLSAQDLYAGDTVRNHPVGTIAYGTGGRIFRYALNGTTLLVAGNLLQSSVNDTQFTDMAVLTTAIVQPYNGLQTGNVTNGTTTVVPTQYIDGSLIVTVTPDLGNEYIIQGITGTLTSGGAMVVALDRSLGTAWTTATKVTMRPSPWAGVIQFPATTQTGIPVGVASYAIAASTSTVFQYGWVQTHGQTSVLSDGQTFAVGSDIGTPSGTAGSVTVYAVASAHARVGTVLQANNNGKQISVFLQID